MKNKSRSDKTSLAFVMEDIRDFKIQRRGRQQERQKKPLGLISKTTTLHVHHAFLCISLPALHDHDVKMPNFTFYGVRKQVTTKCCFSFCTWIWSQEFNSGRVQTAKQSVFLRIQVRASSQIKGREARALRARKTLKPRFTDFFTDFEKKNRLFCSLGRVRLHLTHR